MNRIAIINQYSSAGGGSRFVRSLVTGLAKKYPALEIGLFVDATAVERDAITSIFSGYKNVKIFPLSRVRGVGRIVESHSNESNKKKQSARKIVKNFLKKIKIINALCRFIKFRIIKVDDPWYKFKLDGSVVSILNTYNIVYLAWPYFIEPEDFEVPTIATFHDFNYKQNFGNFSPEYLEIVEKQVPEWLARVKTKIVSTDFIGRELKKFYPNYAYNIETVFLASFNITKLKTNLSLLDKLNLKDNYILSPANTSPHKNLANLIDAYGQIKNKIRIPLVLSGFGTNYIRLVKEGAISNKDPLFKDLKPIANVIDRYNLKLGKDIIPLGYVSDEEIDALIKGAFLVVSTSLYEAGSGPGLDAWNAGTPVAFSNIPPHLEQLDFLRTKAWTFDPKDPEDIAKVIKQALDNPEKSKQMAKESKEAIDKYTWDDVAEGYYKVFKEAIEK